MTDQAFRRAITAMNVRGISGAGVTLFDEFGMTILEAIREGKTEKTFCMREEKSE